MTQIETLAKHFAAAGATLTALQALSKYGIFRLAPRIGEMERLGWAFDHKMISVVGGSGVVRVAEYVLLSRPVKSARAPRPVSHMAMAAA